MTDKLMTEKNLAEHKEEEERDFNAADRKLSSFFILPPARPSASTAIQEDDLSPSQTLETLMGGATSRYCYSSRKTSSSSSVPLPVNKEDPLRFSFACGGWLKYYLFGVAKCIKDHGLDKDAYFIGSSAGALASIGLALGEEDDFAAAVHYSKTICMPQCRSTWLGPLQIAEYTSNCLDRHANLHHYHHLSDGRLTVCFTSFPLLRPVRVSNFDSAQDLKSALMASAACFPMAPLVKFRGNWCLDGGLSDFQPIFSKPHRTITINPFYFSCADIKPSRYIPLWWILLPPACPDTIDWIFDLGYQDALAFFEKTGLLKCDHHEGDKAGKNSSGSHCCNKRPPRQPHAYDQHLTTWQRFVGYGGYSSLSTSSSSNHSNSTNPFSALMDTLTVFWLVLLWKPVALLLIYSELIVRALLIAGRAMINPKSQWPLLTAISPILFLVYIFTPFIIFTTSLFVTLSYLIIASFYGRSTLRDWRHCLELFASIFSISLFLRGTLPPSYASYIEVRKHQSLMYHSVVYRVVQHIL